MSASPNLQLPYIDANQNQKSVTHNQALRMLDALVNLGVEASGLEAPPAAPADGQRWIVAPGATGAWAGRDLDVAAWQDGAWSFFAPGRGTLAYDAAAATLLFWTGTAWRPIASLLALLGVTALGIGTAADASNPLSATLNNALFNALSAGAGGTGDLRIKLNKAAAGNTASFLFQDGFSGRAEIGLAGDDNFHFKVSPDGSAFVDALVLAAATGAASFAVSPSAPTPPAGDASTRLATTGFVAAAVAALVAAAPGALDTLKELADALGDDPNFAATVTSALAAKAPLVSPALAGTPTAPTPAPGDNGTRLATTGFTAAALGTLPGLPRPNTLVIFGSSNAAGLGCSTYAGDPSAAKGWASPPTSWAGLLTAALGAGWTVFNRSISGTGAAQAVARFWTDVAPHKPSHVILATNPTNDGLDPLVVLRNTEVLIQYCEMIGAVPILRGATGFNSYTAAQYAAMLALNVQLDRLGRHRIDHFSTLDDGTGKYVGGSSFNVDGLHPNDAGYRHLFTAIDLGIFAQGPRARVPDPPLSGAWAIQAAAPQGTGLLIGPATGMQASGLASFTLRARIRALAVGGATARAFLNAYLFGTGTAPLRLRNANGPYEVADDRATGVVSTVDPTKDTVAHDLAFSFNAATGLVTAYADGAAYGSFTPVTAAVACTDFAVGSRTDSTGTFSNGYAFSDVALWAVPLQGSAIAEMAIANRMPPASRVFAASLLNTPNPGGQVANIVSNGVQPVIGTVPWTLVSPF